MQLMSKLHIEYLQTQRRSPSSMIRLPFLRRAGKHFYCGLRRFFVSFTAFFQSIFGEKLLSDKEKLQYKKKIFAAISAVKKILSKNIKNRRVIVDLPYRIAKRNFSCFNGGIFLNPLHKGDIIEKTTLSRNSRDKFRCNSLPEILSRVTLRRHHDVTSTHPTENSMQVRFVLS